MQIVLHINTTNHNTVHEAVEFHAIVENWINGIAINNNRNFKRQFQVEIIDVGRIDNYANDIYLTEKDRPF